MIIFDASVLIAHLSPTDQHHAKAQILLEVNSSELWAASTMSLAETLVFPARQGRLKEVETALRQLGVEELGMGADAPGRLAMLRAETALKMPDCCVLLAAQDHEGLVASFDTDLLAAARKLSFRVASGLS